MSMMSGCDYGASTDYGTCRLCACRRPVAALELANGEMSATHDIGVRELVCADRDWCAGQIGARADVGPGSTREAKPSTGPVSLSASKGGTVPAIERDSGGMVGKRKGRK